MMVDPSLDDLMDKIGNKFALITMVSKRARQLNNQAPTLVATTSRKPVTVAMQEIEQGMIIAMYPQEEEPEPRIELPLGLGFTVDDLDSLEVADVGTGAADLALEIEEEEEGVAEPTLAEAGFIEELADEEPLEAATELDEEIKFEDLGEELPEEGEEAADSEEEEEREWSGDQENGSPAGEE